MEYALTYALYNWKRIDPSKGIGIYGAHQRIPSNIDIPI